MENQAQPETGKRATDPLLISLSSDVKHLTDSHNNLCAKIDKVLWDTPNSFENRIRLIENWRNTVIGKVVGIAATVGAVFAVVSIILTKFNK